MNTLKSLKSVPCIWCQSHNTSEQGIRTFLLLTWSLNPTPVCYFAVHFRYIFITISTFIDDISELKVTLIGYGRERERGTVYRTVEGRLTPWYWGLPVHMTYSRPAFFHIFFQC